MPRCELSELYELCLTQLHAHYTEMVAAPVTSDVTSPVAASPTGRRGAIFVVSYVTSLRHLNGSAPGYIGSTLLSLRNYRKKNHTRNSPLPAAALEYQIFISGYDSGRKLRNYRNVSDFRPTIHLPKTPTKKKTTNAKRKSMFEVSIEKTSFSEGFFARQ